MGFRSKKWIFFFFKLFGDLKSILTRFSADVYKIAFGEQILSIFRSRTWILAVFWSFEVLKSSLESTSDAFWRILAFQTL